MPACGHLLTMIRGRATTSASCRQQHSVSYVRYRSLGKEVLSAH